MKFVFLRHGMTDDSHNVRILSYSGKVQLISLVECIRLDIGDVGAVAVLTSPAKRAIQSGEIFAEAFQVDHHPDRRLGDENGDSHRYDVMAVVEEWRQSVADTVIIVTHIDAFHEVPEWIVEKEFSQNIWEVNGWKEHHRKQYGAAYILDLGKRTSKLVAYGN